MVYLKIYIIIYMKSMWIVYERFQNEVQKRLMKKVGNLSEGGASIRWNFKANQSFLNSKVYASIWL